MPPNNAPHNALTAAIDAALARGEPPVVNQPARQTLVMSFEPDGSVEFTRNKALDGFFGGRGNMKRVTDIQKLPNDPLYFIQWQRLGPFKDLVHTVYLHNEVFGNVKPSVRCKISEHSKILLFYSYEDAVTYEIECLNSMRQAGIVFDDKEAEPSGQPIAQGAARG